MFFLHRKILTVLILFHLGILFSGGKVSHFLPLSTLGNWCFVIQHTLHCYKIEGYLCQIASGGRVKFQL